MGDAWGANRWQTYLSQEAVWKDRELPMSREAETQRGQHRSLVTVQGGAGLERGLSSHSMASLEAQGPRHTHKSLTPTGRLSLLAAEVLSNGSCHRASLPWRMTEPLLRGG